MALTIGKQNLHFATSFGFNNVYPRLTRENQNIHGEQYVGLKGLLEWLELHLGCYQKDSNDSIRIALYKKAVAKALEENPYLYYADSYDSDGWATAKQLLSWRDELRFAMWDMQCDDSSLQRLYAIASIETHLDDFILGVNDRWLIVLKELMKGDRHIPLDSLYHYEEIDLLHPFFSKLFTALEKRGVELFYHTHTIGYPETRDLDHFKQVLYASTNASRTNKVSAKGDNSIVILRAENDLIIANYLSRYLQAGEETVILLKDRGEILERTMIKNGLPAMGFVRVADEGNLDQLFLSITVFLWKPMNVERLIQYLTLPKAPIASKLRLKLARSLAKVAGINNQEWNDTLKKYFEDSKYGKKAESSYKRWFERSITTNEKGATLTDIVSLYSDLQEWATTQSALTVDDELKTGFHNLITKCQTLIEVIRIEYNDSDIISEIQFANILEEIESQIASKPETAEVGSFFQVNAPGNITDVCRQVVWWNFLETPNPVRYRMTIDIEEQEFLKDKIELYGAEKELEHWYQQLKTPFLRATDQIILCLPQKVNGEIAEPNPLLNDIIASFDQHSKLIIDIDLNSKAIETLKHVDLVSVDEVELPGEVAAEWQIQVDQVFKRRELESFSSLNLLYNYPSEYFLQYVLGIRPVEIPEVSVTNLLRGNLAHRIAEQLYKTDKVLELADEKARSLIDKLIHNTIQEEGMIFLLPKNELSFDRFKTKVVKSLMALTEMIKSNGWSIHQVEKKAQKTDLKIPLTGYIDLELKRGDELAIVDLKWGGKSSKSKELKECKDIQLVIYDRMKQSEAKTIHLSYFIISDCIMLSRNTEAFSQAREIGSEFTEVQLRDTLWSKMINTYEERWAEFNKGMIEVGDDVNANSLASTLYISSEEDYLIPKQSSSKKESNKYSKYNSIKGK